jgi:hypothetical protein
MAISYNFDGDTKPDDVKPDVLYQRHPFICTGITLFDIYVANCDRNPGNLKVDNPQKPTTCYLIDHERALFYIYAGEGIKRLESRAKRLGVTDAGDSDDEWHCLVELLDSVDLIGEWVKRIQSIPGWFIDGICDEIATLSINRRETEAVKAFLKSRRDGFDELILNHKDRFISMPPRTQWPLIFK